MTGNFDSAEKHFLAYLKKRPDDIEGLFNIGQVKIKAGKNREAVPYFKKFLELAPKDDKRVPMLRSFLGQTGA